MALTDKETKKLVELLEKLQWPVPKEVFHVLTRKTITVPLELCVLDDQNRLLTFYRKDEEYDVHHTPGTVLRDNESVSEALKRLIASELVDYNITGPENIGWVYVSRGNDYGQDPNRHEVSLVFMARLAGKESGGSGIFSPLDALPENILFAHHLMAKKLQQYLIDSKPILG